MIAFEHVPFADAPWSELDAAPDQTVFQRRTWLRYLQDTRRARPVTAAAVRDGDVVGWFVGAVVRRAGVPILGSPMLGWATSYQGFVAVDPDVARADLLEPLATYAFGTERVVHLELMDRRGSTPRGEAWTSHPFPGWELDLRRTEAELLAGMSASCRANLNKGERRGIRVREVGPAELLAVHRDHVRRVFERQGRKPNHPPEHHATLLGHLDDAERVLLLAEDDASRPLASGIFVGTHQGAYLYSLASGDERDRFPNEAIVWAAIRAWRERGAATFDFGGGGGRGNFKAKWGGEEIAVPWVRRSRWPAVEHGRRAAVAAVRKAQRR